jgi:GTP cyclohydrolase II
MGRSRVSKLPVVSNKYSKLIEKLVVLETDNITVFYGCRLLLPGVNNKIWVCPVVYSHEGVNMYLHLFLVNKTPNQFFKKRNLKVHLFSIDENLLKITPSTHRAHYLLQELLNNAKMDALLRLCDSGSPYFSLELTVPAVDQKIGSVERLRQDFNDSLGWNIVNFDLVKAPGVNVEVLNLGNLELNNVVSACRYEFDDYIYYCYKFWFQDDLWKEYVVLSPKPLQSLDISSLSVRLDSGCDIGQLYNDCGCDCREQLLTSLTGMHYSQSGIIIHMPTQDGRGYGMAIKMETEGYNTE